MHVVPIALAFIAITAHALPTPPSDGPDLGGRVVDRRININWARRPPPKVRTLLADAEIFDNLISWGTPFSKRGPAQNAPAILTDGADDTATAYSANTLDTAGTTGLPDTTDIGDTEIHTELVGSDASSGSADTASITDAKWWWDRRWLSFDNRKRETNVPLKGKEAGGESLSADAAADVPIFLSPQRSARADKATPVDTADAAAITWGWNWRRTHAIPPETVERAGAAVPLILNKIYTHIGKRAQSDPDAPEASAEAGEDDNGVPYNPQLYTLEAHGK
ncbi:hypothetical protein BFW01_g8095 [Lasiodiplodia theobromae]|nr:hypothetical protein BFW01_g8095 [Lasiodiplodia theobromae]